MQRAHAVERAVGIEYYVSDADGTGGRLRARPEDFRVRERERFATEPVDADPGAYPHLVFRATLHRWDTNDFAAALSSELGISRERVSWAGTKDKRAVTTQLFSVDGVDPDDVPDISDADIEVVGRAGRPVLFGDLAGNDFEVVVRNPERPDQVDAVLADLRAFAGTDGGDGETAAVAVPNYFGQQRFGSKRPVTHRVGLEIVRGNWKAAVLAYVGNPSEREPDDTRQARAYVDDTEDWQGALDRLPDRLGFERSMAHRLVENGAETPEDYRAALEAVPTNLQQLFVNAAQSYVFNRIVSDRLARGLPFDRPVAGDVVCFADREVPSLPDTDRTQQVTDRRVDTVARHCERGRAFVTAPLVGTDTELAEGQQGDIERAVLSEVGIEPADFALPDEFGSSGTRRAIRVSSDLTIDRDPLALSFGLPKGSYATVLLREFLKAGPDAMD